MSSLLSLSRLRPSLLLARLPAPLASPLLARAALFGSASRATAAAAAGAPAIRGLLSVRALSSSSMSGLSRMGAPSARELEPLVAGRHGGMKPRRNVSGVITINNSWNNTKCNISDTAFQTKAQVSGGMAGFKKSKRSSVFAMEKTVTESFVKARQLGIRKVMVVMCGTAMVLRKPLMNMIREQSQVRIMKLRMQSSVPHGGCRPRKSRRRRMKTKKRK